MARIVSVWVVVASLAWLGTGAARAQGTAQLTPQQQARIDEAKKLYAQAQDLNRQGKNKEALPLMRQALAIATEVRGARHVDVGLLTHDTGFVLQSLGDHAAARPYYEQAVAIRRHVLGNKHAHTALSLNNLGQVLQLQGDLAAARKSFEQALEIRKEVLGLKHGETAVSLNNLALVLQGQGDYAAARSNFEQALAISKEALGVKHRTTATVMNNLAELIVLRGDYKAAWPFAEQALAIRRELLGDKHADTITSLSNMGYLAESDGDYATARTCYEYVLAARRESLGPKHAHTIRSLTSLARMLHLLGDYGAARSYFEQALELRKELFGLKHNDTATSLNYIGHVFKAQGSYAAARTSFEQALAIKKEVLGLKHRETATTLNNLAELHEAMGDFKTAQSYNDQALAIRKEVLGDKHAETITSLNNVGFLLQRQGNYAAARPYYDQVLAFRQQALGPKHPHTAGSLNALGILLQAQGDFAAARPYYEQALEIRKERFGLKHTDTATSLNNMGFWHQAQGDYAAARSYYEQALTIKKEVLGPKHRDTALALSNLAVVIELTGDYKGAWPYNEQALAIRQEVLGPKHPETFGSLNNVGYLLQRQGDYAAARSYYDRVLAGYREVSGPKHPDTAHSLYNLGFLMKEQGDYAAARSYYEQSLAIRREVLGPKDSRTASTLNEIALTHAGEGAWTMAAGLADEGRRVTRRHVARVLPGLSTREQSEYLSRHHERGLHISLSLGWTQRGDASLAGLSAGWLLNGKGVAQEALAQKALLARDTQNPATAGTVQQLAEIRRELGVIALSAPAAGQEASHRQRIAQLESQEEQFSRQIAQANGQGFQADPWVEVSAVRKAIPRDAVLVEIARFRTFDFAAKGKQHAWQAARYAAWIIPPAGEREVKIVDLGEAQAIDRSAATLRQALEAATGTTGEIADQGEVDAEKLIRKPLEDLAGRILTPLREHLADCQQVILSPDAALWLVPWSALPLGDGRYAIEQYQMRYVVSGRDLVAQGAAAGQTAPPVIMADPNYDLGSKETLAATQAVLRTARPASGSELRSAVIAGTNTGLPKVARLPGTGREATAITPKLQAYAGAAPLVYTDQWALEGVFKAVQRPKVLVMSTHGFFLPDQAVKSDDRSASAETRSAAQTVDGQPAENPLLRCGLLLTGCNSRDPSLAAGAEDGVLTGMEIVGMDLRGTDLVVLSACETGLGQVRNGEGVAGLRQSFQLAGAQAVVATLWQIPDQESAHLMTGFFGNLAAGQNKADALRDAQLALIKSRRESQGAAHPFFWAAFTLTGR